MKKLILAIVLMFGACYVAKAQNYHELGVGFSGMRTWKINPPEDILQDLNYYLNPNISYQLHILDHRLAVGVGIGLTYEIGSYEENNDNGFKLREDVRKAMVYQITGSVNLYSTQKSFFQVTVGARASRVYFFSHYSETRTESSFRSSSYEIDSWYDPNYSLLTSLAYQRALFSKLNAKQSFNVRVAWDFMYHFHVYRRLGATENKFASIAMGPSVSLVWRIRGKKNRGLF